MRAELIKEFGSKFSLRRKTPEEVRAAQQPKRCKYNNQDEQTALNSAAPDNANSSSKIFHQTL